MLLEGKIAIINGGATGMGRAEAGAPVFLSQVIPVSA